MSTYVYTNIILNGNVEEIIKVIDIIKKNKYLNYIRYKDKNLDNVSKDELNVLFKNCNEIKLEINGPYGRYKELIDTKIFEEISVAVPNISFQGIIKGNLSENNVELKAELKNKILYFEYFESFSDDNENDKYLDYIHSAFPMKKFCKIFNINEEKIDEENYENFLSGGDFDTIKYEDFIFYFKDSNLTEESFKNAMNNLIKLNIMDYNSFAETIRKEKYRKWEFNPLNESPKFISEAEKYAREICLKPDKIDFEGKIFVHTCCGDALDKIITDRGGFVKNSITLKTNYLIIGDHIGFKTTKITKSYDFNKNKDLNIIAMTLSEFYELIK